MLVMNEWMNECKVAETTTSKRLWRSWTIETQRLQALILSQSTPLSQPYSCLSTLAPSLLSYHWSISFTSDNLSFLQTMQIWPYSNLPPKWLCLCLHSCKMTKITSLSLSLLATSLWSLSPLSYSPSQKHLDKETVSNYLHPTKRLLNSLLNPY